MTEPDRPEEDHTGWGGLHGLGGVLRAAILTVAVALVAGAVVYAVARPDPAPTLAPRYDGVPLRAWAAAALDSAAAEAGVSFNVRPAVRPLDPDRLGNLTRTEGYRRFLNRCTSCHDTPDPSIHGPSDWRAVVRRMAGWMEKAGVLPIAAADSTAIIEFLEQAARIRD